MLPHHQEKIIKQTILPWNQKNNINNVSVIKHQFLVLKKVSLVFEIHPTEGKEKENENELKNYFYIVLKNAEGLRKSGAKTYLQENHSSEYRQLIETLGLKIVSTSLSPSWAKEETLQGSLKAHDSTLQILQDAGLVVEPVPLHIRNLLSIPFMHTLKESEESLSDAIGEDFYKQLFPYQKEGVRYCITRGGRAFIADEMGLGKTFQALAVFNYFCNLLNVSRSKLFSSSATAIVETTNQKGNKPIEIKRKMLDKDIDDKAGDDGKDCELENEEEEEEGGGVERKKKKKKETKKAKNNKKELKEKREGKHHRLLVICPSSVKENWCQCLRDKSRRHLLGLKKDDIETQPLVNVTTTKSTECKIAQRIDKGNQELFGESLVMTFSLAAADQMSQVILQSVFDFIIVDESHNIKCNDAKRTKILMALCAKALHCLCLSGTPMSRPREIWTQIRAIQPKLFPLFWCYPKGPFNSAKVLEEINKASMTKNHLYFAARYCDPQPQYIYGRKRPPIYVFNGSRNAPELYTVLRHCLMTRHMKASIAMQLPSKTRERIIIDRISGKEEEEFKKNMERIATIKEEWGNLRGNSVFMNLWHKNSEDKIPKIIEYWKTIIEPQLQENPEQKIVIFAHHQKMLDELESEVLRCTGKQALGYIRIDGAVNSDQRKILEQQFQTVDTTRVALLSICAAGTGITLTRATHLYFCELYWSPEHHLQAEDRIHRVGQKYPVTIQYLIVSGSTDDILWSLVCSKARTAGQVLDNRAHYLKAAVSTASTCVVDDDNDDEKI
jgi:SNF2 family DNA or RNA helicase